MSSASRSGSRSLSGSRSDSRSRSASSDSVTLPPPPDHPAPGRDNTATAAPSTQGGGFISLFVGLGPSSRFVKLEDLRRTLESNARNPEKIKEIRLRGRCAFADIVDEEEANNLIQKLDGTTLADGRVRLTVQISKNKKDSKPSHRTRGAEGPQVLFVGLGPNGLRITDDELKERLNAVCPVRFIRRKEQCAFVEVESRGEAENLIEQLNSKYIGDSRLSVQYSRKREREEDIRSGRRGDALDRRAGGGVGRRGDDRYGGRRSRSRSHSRSRSYSDRRHRRHRRRYSDESRDSRRRSRRSRRDRRSSYSSRSASSRSYSSRSRSASSRSDRRRGGRRGPDRRR